MAGTQLICPHCGTTLTFAQGLSANATVRCLMCDREFAVRPATAAAVPSARAPMPQSPMPKARAASARLFASVAAPPSSTRQSNAKCGPRPAAVAAESGPRRALGGVVLTAVALLLLGGLMLLFWNQVLADRWTKAKDTETPDPVALAPTASVTPQVLQDPISPSVPATGEPKKKAAAAPKDPDEVDVGDLKPKTPVGPAKLTEPMVMPEPAGKPDPDPKVPDGPSVTAVIPGTPAAPGVDAPRVDAAIARGVAFLKKQQQPDGSWNGGPALGYGAMRPGSSGVPCARG